MGNIEEKIINYVKNSKIGNVYVPVDVRSIQQNICPDININPLSIKVIHLIDAGYLKIAGGQRIIGNPDLLVVYNK